MNVLITGHSSGVGLSLIKKFLDRGDIVVGISRSSCGIISKSLTEISIDFSNSSEEEIEKLDSIGCVEFDVVINNAGEVFRGYIEEHSVNKIVSITNVNFLYPSLIISKTRVKWKNQSFVNVLSGASIKQIRMLSVYSSAKSALERFSKQIVFDDIERGYSGSKMINIYPGPIDTKMVPDHYRKDGIVLLTADEVSESIVESIETKESYSEVILRGAV